MATNDSYIPAEYNTGIIRGDYFEERFQLSINGNVVDLTGADARIQLRSLSNVKVGEYTIIDSDGTNDSGIRVTDDNIIIWIINEADTVKLAPGVYNYDIEVTISGKPRTYIRGQFNVERDVTI